MAISINGPALPSPNDAQIQRSFARISSGSRINSAADDPAGLSIATRISSRISGFSTAIRNAGDGISLSQTAQGSLGQVTDNLQRIRQLALQASNGVYNDSDRAALQQEAAQILESTRQLLKQSNFNGVNLFDSSDEHRFQAGAEGGEQIVLEGRNLVQELSNFGLESLDISSQQGAISAVSVIDDSLQATVDRAAQFGALSNRFEAGIRELETAHLNATEARSRIADTDIAAESANLATQKILTQAQIAIRAQANAQARFVLNLLSG
ncbi:flagellin [Hahella sp. CR1]|uniref:flagellin N-terminal helical domain-containing protein n=1 Tax=Hahella sp. CR1 TaxID=2992807 RepID=UPI0024420FB4|nr:flagellin [Hahella sp. CR1]MDG9666577.1 flagellin [Hahella sp. CR1]